MPDSMFYQIENGQETLEFPLSEYSDDELLTIADDLLSRPPQMTDPTNNAWAMGYISLELHRRLYHRRLAETE